MSKRQITVEQMKALRDKGASYTTIAKVAGITRQRVQQLLKAYGNGKVPSCGPGRPPKKAPLPLQEGRSSRQEVLELIDTVDKHRYPETYNLIVKVYQNIHANNRLAWGRKYHLIDTIIDLSKLGYQLRKGYETACNREWTKAEQDFYEKKERKVQQLSARLPFGWEARINTDPRGYAVKLINPFNWYNTWGGADEGWGLG